MNSIQSSVWAWSALCEGLDSSMESLRASAKELDEYAAASEADDKFLAEIESKAMLLVVKATQAAIRDSAARSRCSRRKATL
jgi:hypothetical protein